MNIRAGDTVRYSGGLAFVHKVLVAPSSFQCWRIAGVDLTERVVLSPGQVLGVASRTAVHGDIVEAGPNADVASHLRRRQFLWWDGTYARHVSIGGVVSVEGVPAAQFCSLWLHEDGTPISHPGIVAEMHARCRELDREALSNVRIGMCLDRCGFVDDESTRPKVMPALPSVAELARAAWLEDAEVEKHIEDRYDVARKGIIDADRLRDARKRAWDRDDLGKRTHWMAFAERVLMAMAQERGIALKFDGYRVTRAAT